MTLTVAVPKETKEGETRVAAIPETVEKLIALGCAVTVESGAGAGAFYPDEAYQAAGAKIAKNAQDTWKGAAIILTVNPPAAAHLGYAAPDKGGSKKAPPLLVGGLRSFPEGIKAQDYAKAGLDAFAMELMPRISRAQSMDILSSQSNLAGYKAVLDASAHFTRALPMMMTAAGTIKPAKIFVMGVGVAGLQAIATARRLGAVVSATDVRPATKEQVESLGAKFIAVEDEEFKQAETAGGYAKEMSAAYQKKQAALVEEHIAGQDIVITTALIPGRPAPRLVSAKMVRSMKPGSVLVDLAVESGGNVEGSKAGKIVSADGVKIIGHTNVPGRLATDASALFARNVLNLLSLLIDRETGNLSINWDDEIIKGIALTKGGKIIHPQFASQKAPKEMPAEKKPAKKTENKKKAPPKKTTPKKTSATTQKKEQQKAKS